MTSLDKIITKFWAVEDTPKSILRSKEDIFCESNFINTTNRDKTGRYTVSLPFKTDKELGTSRNIALAQYYRMEQKLLKTPDIKDLYDKTILEYLELGHMKRISHPDVNSDNNFYLPHHAVIKKFNASCPSSNKKSLNDILHPGPILQQDLVLQILKWRLFKYVSTRIFQKCIAKFG